MSTLLPELKEFAAPTRGWNASAAQPGHDRRITDAIARSEGYARHGSPYELFEEMEDKDAHLFSLLQTRRLGLLARRQRIEGQAGTHGATDAAREAEAWLAATVPGLRGWHGALLHLLGALAHGLAVVEIVWEFNPEGRLVPRAFKPRHPGRFAVDAAGQWRLLDASDPLGPGTPLPPRKFIIALWNPSDARPHGKGLCEHVYWLYWFKKNNLKFWAVYNERFGAPAIVAKHPIGLNETERERLRQVVDALQTEAGITVPEGITLELLEARRSGGAETYERLAQWCNGEMARAILGQTLTSGEGQRSGSLALGRVHDGVRLDYARADALWLTEIVNTQLLRPMVDLNFGEHVPAPAWSIDLTPELELTQEIEVDRQLLRMGVPLPVAHFYEKYHRPTPKAETAASTTGEATENVNGSEKVNQQGSAVKTLTWDDSNLYSYHLQYGVLTINEVRERLGLPPVTWGNTRPAPMERQKLDVNGLRASPSTGEDPADDGEEISLETNADEVRKRAER